MSTGRQLRPSRFKSAKSSEDARQSRAETSVQLRRKRREAMMGKRRVGAGTSAGAPSGDPLVPGTAARATAIANIPRMAAMLHSATFAEVFQALEFFKDLARADNPPTEDCVRAGILPRIVWGMTQIDQLPLLHNACWIATNLATGSSDVCAAMVDAGVHTHATALLTHPSPELQSQGIHILGNLAVETRCKDALLQGGSLDALAALLRDSSPSWLVEEALWALAGLVKNKPLPPSSAEPLCTPLVRMLHSQTGRVAQEAAFALAALLWHSGSPRLRQVVIANGGASATVKLCTDDLCRSKQPVAGILGALVSGSNEDTQAVVNARGVPALAILMGHDNVLVRKDASWALSNIAAGTKEQVRAVENANVVPLAVRALRQDQWPIQKESAYIIHNLLSQASFDIVANIVRHGAMGALVEIAGKFAQDVSISKIALTAISKILHSGSQLAEIQGRGDNEYIRIFVQAEGPDMLEHCISNGPEKVSAYAISINAAFFPGDAEDDIEEADAAPFGAPPQAAAAGGAAPFAFGAGGFGAGGFGGGDAPVAPAAPVAPSSSAPQFTGFG